MIDDIHDRIHVRRGVLGIRLLNRRRHGGRIRRIRRNREIPLRFHLAQNRDIGRRSRTVVNGRARKIRRRDIIALGFFIALFFRHGRLNRERQIILDRTLRPDACVARRRFHFRVLSDGNGRTGRALIHEHIRFIEEFFRRIGNLFQGARLFRAFRNLVRFCFIVRAALALFFLRGLIHDISFERRRRFRAHIDTRAFHAAVHRDGRSRSGRVKIHEARFLGILRREIHRDFILRLDDRRAVSGIHLAVHRRLRHAAKHNISRFVLRERQSIFIRKRRLIRLAEFGNLREIHRIPHDARISHIDRPRHQRRRRLHIDLACNGNRAIRIQSERRRYHRVRRVIFEKRPQLLRCQILIENIDRLRFFTRSLGIELHLFKIIFRRRRHRQTPRIDDARGRHDHSLRTHKEEMPADFAPL